MMSSTFLLHLIIEIVLASGVYRSLMGNEYCLNDTGATKNEMYFASHEVPFPAMSDHIDKNHNATFKFMKFNI